MYIHSTNNLSNSIISHRRFNVNVLKNGEFCRILKFSIVNTLKNKTVCVIINFKVIVFIPCQLRISDSEGRRLRWRLSNTQNKKF